MSLNTLQVSDVVQVGERILFRAFRRIDRHQTITDRTLLIEYGGGLVREISDQVVAILPKADGNLVAVGHQGAVYQWSAHSDSWSDWVGHFEPPEIFARATLVDDTLYAVGTGRMVVKFHGSGWRRVSDDFGEDEDIDLYGTCADTDCIWFGGSEGLIGKVDVARQLVEAKTLDASLTFTSLNCSDGRVLACANNGTLYRYQDNAWQEFHAAEPVNFTAIASGPDGTYLAAGTQLYRFFGDSLEPIVELPCHSLSVAGGALWSIGIGVLHRYENGTWHSVEVVDPEPSDPNTRKRAVPR